MISKCQRLDLPFLFGSVHLLCVSQEKVSGSSRTQCATCWCFLLWAIQGDKAADERIFSFHIPAGLLSSQLGFPWASLAIHRDAFVTGSASAGFQVRWVRHCKQIQNPLLQSPFLNYASNAVAEPTWGHTCHLTSPGNDASGKYKLSLSAQKLSHHSGSSYSLDIIFVNWENPGGEESILLEGGWLLSVLFSPLRCSFWMWLAASAGSSPFGRHNNVIPNNRKCTDTGWALKHRFSENFTGHFFSGSVHKCH